ncbi:hypothetical protein E3O25_14220 [Cryobacterium sp. TMT1-3]|uniref:Uncharacterized protein n=1 Tax=Cryobacterium luteum TaxID=1424661 RepID=A0A5F0D1H5_9MICO|nr:MULTISPECIES: hypothetical protein [Cryobacterium]TFB83934.1 hypothetical protein E3O10_16790 [Cryobacterium luteum]TFC25152.1 hypothetical protein E3O25_14220 [Cryobacterium sp. TMT1-3]
MTVPLNFTYPDSWVELHLDDVHAGAIMAAQVVLSRFDAPVSRELAADLETRFEATANLMVSVEADAGFALVPDAPNVGLLGALIVRWRLAAGDGAVADAITESLAAGPLMIDDPEISPNDTPLGKATLCIQRYVNEPQAIGRALRRGRARKSDAVISEHICWYWLLDDHAGPTMLLTVTTTTDDLTFTPTLRTLTEEFAKGITRGD